MVCFKCLNTVPDGEAFCPFCSVPTAYVPDTMRPRTVEELGACFIEIAKSRINYGTKYEHYIIGNPVPKWFKTALRTYGGSLRPEEVLFAGDETLFSSGKNGIIISVNSFGLKGMGETIIMRFDDVLKISKTDIKSPVYVFSKSTRKGRSIFLQDKYISILSACHTLYCRFYNLPLEGDNAPAALPVQQVPQQTPAPVQQTPQQPSVPVQQVPQQTPAPVQHAPQQPSAPETAPQKSEVKAVRKTDLLSEEDRKKLFETASRINGFQKADNVGIDISNAVRKFASGLNTESVLFIISTSLFGFKTGFIFTDDRMYYYSNGEKRVILYKDYSNLLQDKKNEKRYFIRLKNGQRVPFETYDFQTRADSVKAYLDLVKKLYNENGLFEKEEKSFMKDLTDIVSKYHYRLSEASDNVSIIGNIDKNKFNNAKNKYASNAIYEQCLLLADNSLFGSGKNGIMITLWGVYCGDYGDLISVSFFDIAEVKTSKKKATIKLKNETTLVIESGLVYEDVLGKLINDIKEFYNSFLSGEIKYDESDSEAAYYYSLLSVNPETAKSASTAELKEKYNLGNPFAGIELADRYLSDKSTAGEAINIYNSIQHPVALRKLGEIYFAGDIVEKDTNKAESYFKKARKLGDLESDISIANFCFLGINRKINYNKAFEIYDEAYNSVSVENIPVSMLHNLGVCYKYGYGTEIDVNEAEKLFSLAKDKDLSAKYQLAEIYTEYPDFAEKSAVGVQYLNELIAEGYVQAKTLMGRLLFEGRYVEINLERACGLLREAAESGDIEAKYQLALIGVYSKGEHLSLGEAFELMQEAANSNHIAATRDLAVMYQFGIGVKKDIFSAKQYYDLAAAMGDSFSSGWKAHTKSFLNKLRSADYVCDPDTEDDESPFISYDAEEAETSENGLDSFVFSYGDLALMKAVDYGSVHAKRKLNNVEGILKNSSATGISVIVSQKQFSNFPNFFQRQGHGTAMEYAAHVDDLLHYKHARWIGGSNEAGGADRTVGLINQTQIQSKCFESSNQGIRNLLDSICPDGHDKYPGMLIEVNDDLYKNPRLKAEVDKRYGEGTFDSRFKSSGYTHEQTVNMTKFGTFDSIKVDVKAGHVAARGAFALSFAISFGVSMINGSEPKDALKQSAKAGIKTYGTVITQHIITAQFLKTAAGKSFITNSGDAISKFANKGGVKNVLTKATGASSMTAQSASKIVKTTLVSNAALTAVMAAPDILRIIEGRESGRQLVVNTATNASSILAGSAGYYVGAACGSVVPVVGTFIGGMIGAAIAGSIAGNATRGILTEMLGDDEKEMLDIFNNMLVSIAEAYVLSEDEINFVVDELQSGTVLTQNGLRDIYAADDRKAFCAERIRPVVEEVCELRAFVVMPKEEDYIVAVSELAEATE